MKITVVLGPFQALPPEGMGAVEKVWSTLARAFVREGHEVTLLGKASSSATQDGVKVVAMRGFEATGNTPMDLAKDLAYAADVMRRIPRSDVVVTNTFWLPVLLPLFKSRTGRIVVHVARFPKGQMTLYRGADVLQAISSSVASAIAAEVPSLAQRTHVIGYPVDLDVFRPDSEARLAGGPPLVLYVGRIHPEKGIDLLLRAFREVAPRVPNARLEVIGPVSEQQGGGGAAFLTSLRETASGLDVRFLDPIADPEKLARAYARSDCFCYPSTAERGEAFGLAVLEAMACGAPCVVSALGCFRDFVRHGENGLVFDHRAAAAPSLLAEAIVSLLSDRERAGAMGTRARADAQRFSIDAISREYLALFRRAAA